MASSALKALCFGGFVGLSFWVFLVLVKNEVEERKEVIKKWGGGGFKNQESLSFALQLG